MSNGTTCFLAAGGSLIGGAVLGIIGTYTVVALNLPPPPKQQQGENGQIMMMVRDGLVDQNDLKYNGMSFEDKHGTGTNPDPVPTAVYDLGPVILIRTNSIYCYYLVGGRMQRFGPYPDEYSC